MEDATKERRQGALVIDDDEHWVAIMKRALGLFGWSDVRCLTDPTWAVQIAAEFRPQIIFLDLRMHTYRGTEVLASLRRELPAIPVVIVTGVNAVEHAVNCMRQGAADYITKPLDKRRLEEAINNALQSRPSLKRSEEHSQVDVRDEIRSMPVLPGLKEVPDMLIDEALVRSNGVVKDAAAMLGISAQAICNRRRRREDAVDDAEATKEINQ